MCLMLVPLTEQVAGFVIYAKHLERASLGIVKNVNTMSVIVVGALPPPAINKGEPHARKVILFCTLSLLEEITRQSGHGDAMDARRTQMDTSGTAACASTIFANAVRHDPATQRQARR